MMPARFTKDDWLAFGLSQLASDGPDALKLSALCAAANKTIGSFYHHFKDQLAYFEALLEFWKKKNTCDIIEQLSALPDCIGKAKHLEIIAMVMDQTEDVGIRILAQKNAIASGVVTAVDQMRIEFMKSLYQDQLDLSEQDAQLLAQLEYAAFVGTQTIWPDRPLEHGQSLSALFQKLVRARYAADSPRS
jgi:AcrR family transcriptional regulator